MRSVLSGSVALMLAVSGPVVAEGDAESHYEIVMASADTVWRLNKRTGEIAVCSLLEEQLLCTSSSTAIVPPELSYEELELRRESRTALAEERRIEKQRRQQAVLEAMLAAFKNIAAAGKSD